MKKRFCKLLYIFISVTLYFFNADANAEMPRVADISVSGIFLSNPESTKKSFGMSPDFRESSDDFPTVQVCNSDKTEILTLVFHYGDVFDSVSEFRLMRAANPPSDCLQLTERLEHFITGKGVHLGISKKELVEILGEGFTEQNQTDQMIIRYRIEDGQSGFLRKYNLPIYYGTYSFKGGELVKAEFGFVYP
ncbi:MAG: hypothetical protein HY956_02740 [Deltaproteobacteria bacterium]|nr:hypothetical protein [Deltaproteobacteria bacterium]